MTTKKRRVIFITKGADHKLLSEQRRLKKETPKGEGRNIKVSQVVEDLILEHL